MLANYWPWGSPGGGAPCASALRRKNVPLEPLYRSGFELLSQDLETNPMLRKLYNTGIQNGTQSFSKKDFSKVYNKRCQTKRRENEEEPKAQPTPRVTMDTTHTGYKANLSQTLSSASSADYRSNRANQSCIKHDKEKAVQHNEEEGTCCHHFSSKQKFCSSQDHSLEIDHRYRRNNLNDILYRMSVSPLGTIFND